MALDPSLERLPEHDGPAFRTWQLIMQTTMGSVVQQHPSALQLADVPHAKSKLLPAEEFIPLNSDAKSTLDTTDKAAADKAPKRKKENSNEQSNNFTPWKTIDHYPEDPVGYISLYFA